MKQKKRAHAPFDPKAVPGQAPKFKGHPPRLTKQQFAALEPPVQIASAENVVGLFLSAALLVAPTPEDLAETPEVQFSPEVQRLVTLFESDPIQIYEFVRNNFVYEPYYGSVKGSQSTLLLQGGNDFDQASVLIALYRAAGIPARYVYGTVEIPIEKAMKWLGGITNPKVVGEALVSNGIPAKLLISGGAPKFVQLEHTWVEAYLPYENYRGRINKPNAKKSWVPLDPSFKLHDPNPSTIDLAAIRNFDADAFFTQYLQTVRSDTPAKEYLRNSIDYVAASLPGQRFYDLLSSGPLQEKVLDLLPNTLPYPTKVTGSRFARVPDTLRHRVSIEVGQANAIEFTPSLQHTATWTDLLHKRLTLSYEPASVADAQTIATYGNLYDTPPYLIHVKPILKLEGQTLAEGGAVPMASDLAFRMTFTAANGEHQQTVNNILTAGATHAIALDAGYLNGRVITDRTTKWQTAVTAGEQGDSVIGEFLNLLAVTYLQELDSSRKITAHTMKLLDTNHQAEVMVGVNLVVRYSFGVPRAATVGGVEIDVDRNISTTLSLDGDHSKTKRFYLLDGSTSSALEHAVFESVLSEPTLPVEAVSAVKALQVASSQGIPIHAINAGNLQTKLAALQVDNAIKADIQNAVNAGMVATVSERAVQINSWTGVGYILIDPVTGAGVYRISGGLSGGLSGAIAWLKDEIRQGKMNEARAKEIIKKYRKDIWFKRPVDGAVIKRGFIEDSQRLHLGVDFAVPILTPVHAIAAGTVTYADFHRGSTYAASYGGRVDIDHGLGIVSRYAHNCKLAVKVGDKVEVQQFIALSGNTGAVTAGNVLLPESEARCINERGAHSHFEVIVDGGQVDPINYFGR